MVKSLLFNGKYKAPFPKLLLHGVTILLIWVNAGMPIASGKNPHAAARKTISSILNEIAPMDTLFLTVDQDLQRFGHYTRPWETRFYHITGQIVLTPQREFVKFDTVLMRSKPHPSFAYYSDRSFYTLGYGASKADTPSRLDKIKYINTLSRYSPIYYLEAFIRTGSQNFLSRNAGPAFDSIKFMYHTEHVVTLILDRKKKQVNSIEVLYYDEVLGDVLKIFTYTSYEYSNSSRIWFPTHIQEMEHGTVLSSVRLNPAPGEFSMNLKSIPVPDDWIIKDMPDEPDQVIEYRPFNEHIHLFYFKKLDYSTMVVEFKEFLVVIGAPIGSETGLRLIQKIKWKFKDKPIRYFTFGHHHPYYLGGMRPFIYRGARVLCLPENCDYIRQLASFRHRLRPDELELYPKPLLLEPFDEETTLGDSTFQMRIIKIGMLSEHASDFLIYYFPQGKLLYEDELVYIPETGLVGPGNSRHAGLRKAIEKFELDVETIIQGWPGPEGGYKTIIPMELFLRSVTEN